jgi:hypothetical protein
MQTNINLEVRNVETETTYLVVHWHLDSYFTMWLPSGYNRKARERSPNPKPLVLGFGLGRRQISISSWNSAKLLLRQLLEMAAGSRGDPPQHVKPTTSRCVSNEPSLSIAVFFLTDLSLLHREVWAAHITVCISGCWSSFLHKFAVS